MIASLDENVSGAIVIGRANFVATVRAWRSNQAALQQAIQARMGISQAETNAFLNAQNKVTEYLRRFMNGSGWFHDAPIPEDVRAQVDGPLKAMYGAMAEELKERLLVWEANQAALEANLFFDTLRAFSAGMQEVEDGAQRGAEVMRTFVHAATRVGIGFVPFVGPALDLCEAVTGREWCTPSGRELTTGERVWSGIGFGAGKLVKVWKGISKAGISPGGKAAAAGIGALGPDVLAVLEKAKIQEWKTLDRASITVVEDFADHFEKRAVLYVINKQDHKVLAMGDGVREILGIKKNQLGGLSKHPDVLTVSPQGGLVVSEIKHPNAAGVIDCANAEAQLKNAMVQLDTKNIAAGVEGVQLVIPKGVIQKGKSLQVWTNPKNAGDIRTFDVDIDGYLLKDGVKVTMPGNPNVFVRIVEVL